MEIRELQIDDAEKFLNLINITEGETPHLLYEKGERKTTIEQEKEIILKGKKNGNIAFVVVEKGRLVGFVWGGIFTENRRKHCLRVAIAILQESTGKGYGTKLMNALEKEAFKKRITRFELDVSVRNKIAINLYKKMGFLIEGERKNSYLIDGKFDNDYIMAKII
jgi:ribosomal protein S18 acetylase RimI-like enzyme